MSSCHRQTPPHIQQTNLKQANKRIATSQSKQQNSTKQTTNKQAKQQQKTPNKQTKQANIQETTIANNKQTFKQTTTNKQLTDQLVH